MSIFILRGRKIYSHHFKHPKEKRTQKNYFSLEFEMIDCAQPKMSRTHDLLTIIEKNHLA